jgi:hypothetical protein
VPFKQIAPSPPVHPIALSSFRDVGHNIIIAYAYRI